MNIKYVEADDWEGVYINDERVLEGHSLSAKEMLKSLYKYFEDYETLNFYEINQGYMEEIGDLPYNFNDINEDHLSEYY